MTQLTTAQMKAALAAVNPAPAPQFKEGLVIADVISGTAAGAVHIVETFGQDTVSFLDRVKTGYLFQRKVQAGAIQLDAAAEAATEAEPAALAPPARRARPRTAAH